MGLLDFNAVSVLSGVAAVLLVAFLRLHWPFRFQYMGLLWKKNPDRLMRWLEKSYQKNRSRTVAMLDKSTCEIMAGNYEGAEKFIVEGLTACKETPTLFNQAMVHYLFYNLATVYFYSGKYEEALDVAFRVFERDRRLMGALGVVICAHARLGDVQGAIEALRICRKKGGKKSCDCSVRQKSPPPKGITSRRSGRLNKSLPFPTLGRCICTGASWRSGWKNGRNRPHPMQGEVSFYVVTTCSTCRKNSWISPFSTVPCPVAKYSLGQRESSRIPSANPFTLSGCLIFHFLTNLRKALRLSAS